MTNFRELVNVSILNDDDGWINFFGDSEYEDEKGNLNMGYWRFLAIREEVPGDEYYNLDDEINVMKELKNNSCFKVKNDKGKICVVELLYEV